MGEKNPKEKTDAIVEYLAKVKASAGAEIIIEFRLLCSGEFYPKNFIGDHTKSTVARILLEKPIELFVASQPYDNYPQELALRCKRFDLSADPIQLANDFAKI